PAPRPHRQIADGAALRHRADPAAPAQQSRQQFHSVVPGGDRAEHVRLPRRRGGRPHRAAAAAAAARGERFGHAHRTIDRAVQARRPADRAAPHQRRRSFHVRRGQHARLGAAARLARRLFSGDGGGKQSGGGIAPVSTTLERVPTMRRDGFGRLGIRIVAAALVALCSSAQAQDWPTRPVTMVVPFAAGGAFDVMARIFAPQLSQSLGQQVIVENVGAAAGIVGTNGVAKPTPDGYVFLLGSVGPPAYNQTLYKKLPYNAATDFAPVALFAEQPMVLLTRQEFPADNLQQFIAYAKANAAKLQYGSAGVGSTTHLSCALLNTAAGIDITHVPYRGGGPVTADLIAGQIHYMCSNSAGALPQIASH